MNIDLTPRARSFVSGLAAAAVTTVLVSSLVESFDPALLLRFDDGSAPQQIASADKRKEFDFAVEA